MGKILIINIDLYSKPYTSADFLKETYLPLIGNIIKKKELSFNKSPVTWSVWRQDVQFYGKTVKEFLSHSAKKPFKKSYDMVAVLCDYNLRSKKLLLMLLTFLCRTKLRLAIYSSNEYNILTIKYIVKVILSVIASFLKGFFLKIFFMLLIIVFWMFTPTKETK